MTVSSRYRQGHRSGWHSDSQITGNMLPHLLITVAAQYRNLTGLSLPELEQHITPLMLAASVVNLS